jgi:hypothetical protein
MPQLESTEQRVYESLFGFSRPQSLAQHVVAKLELLWIRVEVYLRRYHPALGTGTHAPLGTGTQSGTRQRFR